MCGCPVLATRKLLSEHQLRAASRFRQLWELAVLSGMPSPKYDHPVDYVVVDADSPSQVALAASSELREVRAMLGVRPFALVVAVCGTGRALVAVNRRQKATAADVLRWALDPSGRPMGLRPDAQGGPPMNEIPYLLQIESDVAAFHYKFPLRFDLIMARRRVMGVFKKTRPAVGSRIVRVHLTLGKAVVDVFDGKGWSSSSARRNERYARHSRGSHRRTRMPSLATSLSEWWACKSGLLNSKRSGNRT